MVARLVAYLDRLTMEVWAMSADNRASVVGQNVYKEGEQIPFGVVAGHLGETEGVNYYSVQTESGTHIYDGADLRLMTHEGLRPFAAYREAGQDAPAPDAAYVRDTPFAPHPFEQVGKAGADPVTSAQGPEGLTTPAYGGTASAADSGYAEYQDFLRWRAGIRDYGDSTDATPLSPAESKAADAGAIEGQAAPEVTEQNRRAIADDVAHREDIARAKEALMDAPESENKP